ncbi:WAP four-disulfide core domain protein 3-like isoform X2 [Bombina bombina]|uniref:WAP four-disulfide core domain protein 3-like isoform X2 n=1 Tax=Bombina bombina TaxID=8345 RepID=UPI00235AC4F3|nr:WAP four-disulfide core domain protein 3-like isoform X2 [Bombina bombina]
MCDQDSKCEGNLKCCSNGCGKTCQAPNSIPKETKPGTCPPVKPGSSGICVNSCDQDSNCEGNLKCCSNGCGTTCQAPNSIPKETKTGSCPPLKPGSAGLCINRCDQDSDCQGTLKCCSNGCGKTCQAPNSIPPETKAGSCPPLKPGSAGICVNRCDQDSDCQGNLKCCSNGCGKTCEAPNSIPQETKAGSCPPIKHGSAGICVNMCDQDSKCEGNLKCCSNGCGKTCQAPNSIPKETKAGTCPPVKPGSAGLCVNSCDQDSNCEGNLKCCSNGCGTTCQAPNSIPKETKTGSCPPLKPGSAGLCINRCDQDSDCQGTLKCCSNGCGKTCQAPNSIPPGLDLQILSMRKHW